MSMSHNSACLMCIVVCLCWPVSTNVIRESAANESDSVLAAARLFPTLPILVTGSANQQCLRDSQLVRDSLRNSTIWAHQMLDASAKSVEGAYVGSIFQMGNFKECVDTEVPIQGQYCLATLTLEPPAYVAINLTADIYNPIGSIWDKIGHKEDRTKTPRNTVHSALCVPASCSHSDLQASLRRHLASTPRNYSVSVHVNAEFCQTNRKGETLSTATIAYCTVMATVFLLVILGTLSDRDSHFSKSKGDLLRKDGNDSNSCGYFQCFSLKRNLNELCASSGKRLGCIYGIKVVSTCGVIYAHTLLLNYGSPFYNYEEGFERQMHGNIVKAMITQIETVVDSFFLMSAILATYVTLCALNKRSVNPFQAIVYRYLRLTPVYAIVIFFDATLLYHTGEGPLWEAIIGPERQRCIDNWWTNLLFVNNYVNDDQMCMIHSWYLAPELLFFIITIFLALLIHKYTKSGYIVLSIFMAASLVVPYVVTYIYHLDPVQFFYADHFKLKLAQPYFRYGYSKSHMHATPTFVGIATGLFLYRTRSDDTKYTWQSTLGLVAGVLISIGCLVPGAFMITHVWQHTGLVAALELPQRRFFWPLGVALIIISLVFSKDSFINKALSSRIMVILSNLTYSAYLVSFGLQARNVATYVTPVNIVDGFIIRQGLADICSTFAVAFVLYLTVEAPFNKIITKLIKPGRSKPSSKSFVGQQSSEEHNDNVVANGTVATSGVQNLAYQT